MGKVAKRKSKSSEVDINKFIHIKGARSNNLKDIELLLPKNKLIVVTGLSGSGKSSLIMDTLYAEGQRRYVESLSSYARQFLNRMKKPEVDFIKGICPAIAIEQKVNSSNARSTVGSLTEIYDFMRLLFARIGITYSPVSGDVVKKHEISDVVDAIKKLSEGTKVRLLIPLQNKYERTLGEDLNLLQQKGFTRITFKNEVFFIEDFLEDHPKESKKKSQKIAKDYRILIDRFVVKDEDENWKRIADSILTCFQESEGHCYVDIIDGKELYFNNKFELDGIQFLTPTHQLFNYNNPYGACPKCEGYGRVLGIDPNKVIPDDGISVYDGAIACWRGQKGQNWLNRLLNSAHNFDFPVHRPIKDLTPEQYKMLWTGNEFFYGIDEYFNELKEKSYKIQNRVMMARYRGRTTCNECDGGRLRKEARYVKVGDKDITQLINIPIDELKVYFQKLKLSKHHQEIAKRILLEINNRIEVMMDVGLSYLTLDRLSSTLSGGETQRINLTRTLGSNLTNSLYILDEPSIGLHPKDSEKLVSVLLKLRDLGNTVVVVEHEEDIIRNADYIVDVGPNAGVYGGEIVYDGTYKSFLSKAKSSLTQNYLTNIKEVPLPEHRRSSSNKLKISGARMHNLKDVDVEIPLNALTVISGVSGSGKTTLVKHILHPAIKNELDDFKTATSGFNELTGDIGRITQVEMINQSPIGRSSRSNPVTYVKAYDGIRKLMASQQSAKIKGLQPKHFSFNVEAGRCETCKGEGETTVEMQFLADVKLTCEDCHGKRFKEDVLDVTYKDKNIFDILNLSIEESLDFFEGHRDITSKLQPLNDVGLGYIKLGQSSSTLSGGEAQRVKLASYLVRESKTEKIFFIFDEPTTGLHFDDIVKLMAAFNALIENGHTVVIIEHNLDVIKCADWLIDLGPVGGKEGGHVMYQGPTKGILKSKKSVTAKYLKSKL